MQFRFGFLFIFFIFGGAIYAQSSQTEDLRELTRNEILLQMTYLQAALYKPESIRAEQIQLRADLIAKSFFSAPFRTYRAREAVFRTALELQTRLAEIRLEEPQAQLAIDALEAAFLEELEEVQNLKEYQDSVFTMRARAAIFGFGLSPGLYLGTAILADTFALSGRAIDFIAYRGPINLLGYLLNLRHWGQMKVYERGFGRQRPNAEKAEACRAKLVQAAEIRRHKSDHAGRDFRRGWNRWQRRLHWRRLSLMSAWGLGASLGLYNFALPVADMPSFEDQHDWDAQEDAVEQILLPFFKSKSSASK